MIDELLKLRKDEVDERRAKLRAQIAKMNEEIVATRNTVERRALEEHANDLASRGGALLLALEVDHARMGRDHERLVAELARQEPDEVDEDPMPPGCLEYRFAYTCHRDRNRQVRLMWQQYHHRKARS